MAWFNIDDRFHYHGKVRTTSLAAIGLWTVGGTYSAQYLTDGWIPEWFPETQRRSPDDNISALVAELVTVHLWEPVKRGGWQMHDYPDWNRTKAMIAEEKERQAQRKAAARARTQKQLEDARKITRTRKPTAPRN